ncbi:MAG: hypothetical protein AB9869_34990 [Verrucomicrobiia bacterium]
MPNADLGDAEHLPPHYRVHFALKHAEPVAASGPSLAASSSKGMPFRLEAVEADARQLSSSLDAILADFVPVGAIAAWWGSYESIPSGWAPCDGRAHRGASAQLRSGTGEVDDDTIEVEHLPPFQKAIFIMKLQPTE